MAGGLTRWFRENWVDLSRPKPGGGFEPCGRPDAASGKYPKCVPASRAARMSDEEIKSAIRRKRLAESTQRREGQKPIMVSTLKKSKVRRGITSIPAPTVAKRNVPTDMELYNRVKAEAKRKFDVYPSAYANGWLVQEYKRRGGKYKTISKHGSHDQSTHGRRGLKRPAPTGNETRIGPEGVECQMAPPIAKLQSRHKIQKDWHEVSASPSGKRALIAKAYDDMPEMDDSPETLASWDQAATEIASQFKQLTERDGIKVEFVSEDPYPDFHTMRDEVASTGVLKVLRTEVTGGHPYWSNETNDQFRAVHDAYGHLGTGRGFDRHGEEAAYQAHISMFSDRAAPALATELRGQNSSLIQNGDFAPQKIGLIPEQLRKRLAVLFAKATAAKITADDDNLYEKGRSHHVTGGRHFANLRKESPTVTDVHVPTIIQNQRRKKKVKPRTDRAVEVLKHASHNQADHNPYKRVRGAGAGAVDAMAAPRKTAEQRQGEVDALPASQQNRYARAPKSMNHEQAMTYATKGGGRAAPADEVKAGFEPWSQKAEGALRAGGMRPIPPAWSDVQVAKNPNAKLLVVGYDAAGRRQAIYSAAHTEAQAAKKFARIKKATKDVGKLDTALEKDVAKDDTAAAVLLMRELGMRPGSRKNTRAQAQAYGATTLEARHVRINKNSVTFSFTGKKGVQISLNTSDPKIVSMVKSRMAGKSGRDPLFNTNESLANAYVKTMMGTGYSVKDLRTLKGTTMALDIVGRTRRAPTTKREFQRMRNEVGDAVAKQLGNTRTLALKSYINPGVFAQWEANLP